MFAIIFKYKDSTGKLVKVKTFDLRTDIIEAITLTSEYIKQNYSTEFEIIKVVNI